MTIDRAQLAAMMDYTLLKPEASAEDVQALIDDAVELGVGAVCVSPNMLFACTSAADKGLRVATVVGFPSGKHDALIKAAEARLAVQFGAVEVDMVIDVARAIACDQNAIIAEVAAVREAVPQPVVLKVILETALLDEEQIAVAVEGCVLAGADYVKTSTGFHPAGGASVEAVRAMKRAIGNRRVGIKASGGIGTYEDAEAMVAAGATRLGVSAARAILDGAPSPSAG